MNKNRLLFIAALVFLSLALSACGNSFGASSWPGISFDEANNSIYVAYNQHVYALQAENGIETWRFPAEAENGSSFYATPALSADGQLIVGGYDNQVYSLDPANGGSLNWSFIAADNRYIASPLSVEAGIFAPNSDHNLYALSSKGELNWIFSTKESLWGAAASDGEALYLPSMDHSIYGLNANNGDLLWQQDVGGTIVGRPTLGEDGTLYAGTFGAELLALNSRNGRIQWRSATEGWIWGSPTLFEDKLFAGDIEGNVYSLDAESGRELWRVEVDGAITGAPLVANEHVYVGTENGQVISIGLDGKIQWTKTFEGQAYSSPVAAGELILFGFVENDAILFALDTNGNTVWSFSPQN